MAGGERMIEKKHPCCICGGSPTLNYVGRKYFCGAHKAQAKAAATRESRLVESEAAVLEPDEVARRRFARAERNGWEAR